MHNSKSTYAELIRTYAPRLTEIAAGQELSETRQLMAVVTDCTLEELMRSELRGDFPPEDIQDRLEPLIHARGQGVPLQHLIGKAYFYGREFHAEAGVFIPRPETELLAEWMCEIIQQYHRPVHVLDLCSGSGVLAIMAAIYGAQVTAVDINSQAIALAKRNEIAQNLSPGTIHWVESDVITWLKETSQDELLRHKYEIIVSNPPYIPLGTPVSATVAHDPVLAVFSGITGLDCISEMLPLLSEYCTAESYIGIEHDISHEYIITQQMCALGYHDIVLHHDLAGLARFTTACWR